MEEGGREKKEGLNRYNVGVEVAEAYVSSIFWPELEAILLPRIRY